MGLTLAFYLGRAEAIAAAVEVQADDVARVWVRDMLGVNGNGVVLSDELVKAIRDLLAICKAAEAGDGKLLHVWFA